MVFTIYSTTIIFFKTKYVFYVFSVKRYCRVIATSMRKMKLFCKAIPKVWDVIEMAACKKVLFENFVNIYSIDETKFPENAV